MNKFVVGLLTFALVGPWASASFAANYFSGTVGAVFVQDSDFDEGPVSGEFTFDPGFALLGAVGMSWKNSGDRGNSGNGGRLEAELGYRQNDIDDVKIDNGPSGSGDGDISSLSLMANLYYDVAMGDDRYAPYLGAGAGAARLEADPDGGSSEDDIVFAGQFIAGISFLIDHTERTDDALLVDVQYRYFATDDPEFDNLETEYSTHNVMVTLRKSF